MSRDSGFISFCYKNVLGRILFRAVLKSGITALVERFLNTRFSKPLIWLYIKRYQIDMSDYSGQKFRNFKDFFARRRDIGNIDITSNHLISPCDGLISAYPIRENSIFPVKGVPYRIQDLVDDDAIAKLVQDGMCLIFRLRAMDYHHFCYIDDGFQYSNHFIQGDLHSVQPVACETVPVYRLNRRMWTLMDTNNFGKVIQIGIGAFFVGEIIHEKSGADFMRGEEMGHFELAGSTIVLLFQKDRIRLCEHIQNITAKGGEAQVLMGEKIGWSVPNCKIFK